MREFYAHLRRHPIPEIMDDTCLAAVANVEAQYGDTITHGAGLEVRLGEQARYVDYIMNIDVEHIPFVSSLWYEIDYAEFAKGGSIEPCLFANLALAEHSYSELWDKMLPPLLVYRAKKCPESCSFGTVASEFRGKYENTGIAYEGVFCSPAPSSHTGNYGRYLSGGCS